MAKKHKKQKTTTEPSTSAAPSSPKTSPTSAVESAFARGNYAAVRTMAKSDASETAKKLLDLTKLDFGQVATGLVALMIVILVALITLK